MKLTEMKSLSIFCALIVWSICGSAAPGAILRTVQLSHQSDRTQVILDLDQPVSYEVGKLSNPDRLYLDLVSTRLGENEQRRRPGIGPVNMLRTGIRDRTDLRVVLDLNGTVRAQATQMPLSDGRHRVILALIPAPELSIYGETRVTAAGESAPRVVIIDPGHGGRDPGAIGPSGTKEKSVTLKIARQLLALLNREPGYQAVLTRNDDRYLHLRERIRIAQKERADLFVSIHADSVKNRRARGSSVFVLSSKGASSEAARWLADRENAADLVGIGEFPRGDDHVVDTVFDLVQEGTSLESSSLGKHVLGRLGQIGSLHKSSVERAGFVVLKSPNIPSILVETAFLSNPGEERKLNDTDHQRHLAMAILDGIRGYFDSRFPRDVLPQSRTHQVKRGETLGGIAHRYRVSLSSLRHANGIYDNSLRAGQTLTIPISNL